MIKILTIISMKINFSVRNKTNFHKNQCYHYNNQAIYS
jgi:hypothetical protein